MKFVTGRPRVLRSATVMLILVSLFACRQEMLTLPEVDDPSFARLEGVQIGMQASDLIALRPRVEVSPEGRLHEPYGLGSITYDFADQEPATVPSTGSSLRSVEWRTEVQDSLYLGQRWTEMVRRVSDAYGSEPVCSIRTEDRITARYAVWQGPLSTIVSSEIFFSADGRGYQGQFATFVGVGEQPEVTPRRRRVDCPSPEP